MRAPVSELHVLASQILLPAAGETVKLAAGRPGEPVADVPAFTEDPRCAGEVPPRLGRRIDRYSALAYAAVSRLVSPLHIAAPERVGVFLANTRAGWGYGETQLETLIRRGPGSVQPYFVTAWFPAACIGEVTIGLGFRGPAKTTTGRLSGFAEALWLARDAFERRAIDLAVVGAAESLVAPFTLLDWPPGQSLPAAGAAEGAAVLAVGTRPAAGRGGAVLRGLRFDGADRRTASDRDWVPTLSIAAGLAQCVTRGPGGDTGVALGGGYHATVSRGEGEATP